MDLDDRWGICCKKKTYTLADLKSKFKQYTYQLTWNVEEMVEVNLIHLQKEINGLLVLFIVPHGQVFVYEMFLEDVGIKDNAVYIGYHAADIHLSRDPKKEPISRGCPMSKALAG